MSRRWKWRIAVYSVLIAAVAGGTYWALRYDSWRDGPDVVFRETPPETVDRMLELAKVTKDDVVYDLGCGDGRIVIAAAKKYGCRAVGVEMRPELVELSRKSAAEQGVGDLVEIRQGDIFDVDLRPATVIAIFLLPEINEKLIPQFQQMRPGTRIVSYLYAMESVKPTQKVVHKEPSGHERTIYLWVTPLDFVDPH